METLLRLLLLICFGFGIGDAQPTFNVFQFGAVGDGKTDDSLAFIKAWEAACGAAAPPTLQIPAGKTFLLQPLSFHGPCKPSSIRLQVDGNIVAPSSPDAWFACESNKWIGFSYVSGLVIVGSGQIDGQGAPFWAGGHDHLREQIIISEKQSFGKCDWPTAMHFNKCDNLQISGITSINSPRNHISINLCTGVSISNIRLIAPGDSPNTDGIDIAESSQVNIFQSFIGTGDDCVAINRGCVGINITHVTCSPGHGISVGSLGKDGSRDTVENVRVQNCIFNRTLSGARIKTWPGGSGYAKNIYIEQITLIEAANPIIIDQHYAGSKRNYSEGTSAVAISDVRFIGFQGTSSVEQAITLDCSKITGCNGIVLDQVNITSSEEGKEVYAVCNNARGTSGSIVLPNVPCLS